MTFILLEDERLSCPTKHQDLPVVAASLINHPGDHGGGVTPVPIPNTAVKPSSADGTARAAWWESRTLPGFS